MTIVLLILTVVLLWTLLKYFTYYCAVKGLLFYLDTTHNDMPDKKKTKELTLIAVERTIKDLFSRK